MPTGRIHSTGRNSPRPYRITWNGTTVTNPNGSEKAYTHSAATKALARLKASTPPPTVRPRMDGLTHEAAAARYGVPRYRTPTASERDAATEAGHDTTTAATTVLMAHQDAHGTHYAHDGTAAAVQGDHVRITEGDRELYSGTLEALDATPAKSRHAMTLRTWGHLLTAM